MPRKPSSEERRSRAVAQVADFIRKYGRRKQKRGEPNDRVYDRDMEASLKRLSPQDLDALMHDDEA
ncbi:hypothetical protein CSW64_06455 [Caulobacter mirabilis]|uniref:Uncharacterized protein n=2 Tax=Caulobacter mirabilis TaxID=69666 RepID=A0A2D2B3T2_9CAUL|nr:hypothetical protein CSW64_06455 [Caulobacter mirabilis]